MSTSQEYFFVRLNTYNTIAGGVTQSQLSVTIQPAELQESDKSRLAIGRLAIVKAIQEQEKTDVAPETQDNVNYTIPLSRLIHQPATVHKLTQDEFNLLKKLGI